MGYVFRELGTLKVHAKSCSIVYADEKIKQLEAEGQITKRRGVGLVIYSESDFDAFYNKHCARISNDNKPFTVLVVDDVNIPSRQEVKTLLEEVLKRSNLQLKKGWFSKTGTIIERIESWTEFNPRHKIRTFHNNVFTDTPRKEKFRFLDVHTLFPSKLEDVYKDGHIAKLERDNLQNIWDSTFKSDCEYAVGYIWIIGHTDVV